MVFIDLIGVKVNTKRFIAIGLFIRLNVILNSLIWIIGVIIKQVLNLILCLI